jgi:hypothetical protein
MVARPEISARINRYVMLAVAVLSAALIWWAVMVRLTGASEARVEAQQRQSVDFRINQLLWQRDELTGPAGKSARNRLEALLIPDPQGMVTLLDQLRTIGADAGLGMRYSVGDRVPTDFDPSIGQRDILLSFALVNYPRVLDFLQRLRTQESRWLFEVRAVKLTGKGGGAIDGRISLRVWTLQDQGAAEEAEFLEL